MFPRNGQPLKFYKNLSGFFVEQQLLNPPITYPTRSVSWVDYDNDGDRDLFVVSDSHGSRLFKQNSDGTFTDVTISSGLFVDITFTFSVSWGDIDNDGCLDLFFSNRTTNTSFPNFLFKNNCDGTFSNISTSAGISTDTRLTFGASFLDYNNDGFQDIYLINDKNFANRLYKNNGDSTFTDVSTSTGDAGLTMDAMSLTIDDYNSDGFFDIYITNTDILYSDTNRIPGNVLLKNVNGMSFEDVTTSSSTNLDGWCWGATFLDAENDEDLDLYISCLYVNPPNPDSYGFYENLNQVVFSQPSNIGFSNNNLNSYGTAIGDVNNDGKVDIIVVNDSENLTNLWVNKASNTNNFLKVNLTGTTSNNDGVGSVIEISVGGNKQYRCVLNGESYLSQNSFTEFFGLGNALVIDYVKVKWLSGIEDIFYNVGVNQTLNITEGSSITLSNNHSNKTNLVLHPNPSNDVIKINSNRILDSFKLYDLNGRSMKFGEISNTNYNLDISMLSDGIYIIVVNSGVSNITMKIIKN